MQLGSVQYGFFFQVATGGYCENSESEENQQPLKKYLNLQP